MSFVCRHCKRAIPDNSIYCNWCGQQQIKTKDEIKVPAPKRIGKGYTAQIMVDGHRKTVTAPTEAEYYETARALKSGKRPIEDDITLSEAITKYITNKQNRLKQRSIEQYEYIRDHRFQSLMGKQLRDITQRDIDNAIEEELSKPSRKGGTIQPKTVRDAYGIVHTVIYKYTGNKLGADLPEIQRTFKEYPTVPQLMKAIKGSSVELPCLLALWLGMSMEEIRGLTKSRSIKGDKLYIVETVVDTKNGVLRKEGAKEKFRPRCYSIPPYIGSLIAITEGDIIEPRSSHAIYSSFQRILKKNNLPRITFHDLRHINTASLTGLRVPSKVIQARNGWASHDMIDKVYDYVFSEEREAADIAIDSFFGQYI